MDHGDIVRQLRDQFPFDTNSAAAIFNFTRRVAWTLKGQGVGLMEKSYGGENEFPYQGTTYSLSRIATVDRHYKILSDAGPGGSNGPTWVDEGPLPDRYGVSFRPALPPDDAAPDAGGGGPVASGSTLDEAVMAMARAQAAELLAPLRAEIEAQKARIQALEDRPQGGGFKLPQQVALRDFRGKYVASDGGRLVPDRDARGEWETFMLEGVE